MKRHASLALAAAILIAVPLGCGRREAAITRPDDARNARIGVMTGSTGEAIAVARFPDAAIKSFDDVMDAITAMKSGQLDATITGFPAALEVTKKNHDLLLLADALDREDTAIAVKKGNTKLLASLNRIIAGLKADGTLESMKQRWFKPDLGPYEELSIALPDEGEPFRVGVSATREPFSFVDKTGRVTGHDGELARLIAARLGRPVKFFDMKFMALIPALDSGKVDVIMTGMTATTERRSRVDFSEPYYANAQVMIVRRAAAGAEATPGLRRQLTSAEDLKGRRIGVLLGSMHDRYATEHYAATNVLQYKSPSDLLVAVKTGKIDAAFWTTESGMEMLRQDTSLAALGEPLVTVPIGMGFRQNHPLRVQFNEFLTRIKADGVYANMVERWMTIGTRVMPEIANARSNGVLVVGIISDDGYPFTSLQDGRLIGFDVEMAERFAAYLGKDVKRVDMEFGSLIAAVSTGKIDMIASTLIITDERKRQIDFSDPYYRIGMSAFALRENIAASGAGTATAGRGASPLARVAHSFRSNMIQENRYRLILSGLRNTAIISLLATAFGSLLGAVVCFMRMSTRAVLNLAARAYIAVLRGTPVLVVLMLVFYVVFASVDINPVLVAVIAFGLNFSAYVAEIFRGGIEGVDKGQTEAGLAMGFTRFATFRYIVMPQMARRILPVYKGEFISLVKMTSIVGYIAVQDLTKASDIVRSRTFDPFFPLIMVAILYFAISWVLTETLDYVEHISDPRRRRKAAHA